MVSLGEIARFAKQRSRNERTKTFLYKERKGNHTYICLDRSLLLAINLSIEFTRRYLVPH